VAARKAKSANRVGKRSARGNSPASTGNRPTDRAILCVWLKANVAVPVDDLTRTYSGCREQDE
jgi:hypothetical protein